MSNIESASSGEHTSKKFLDSARNGIDAIEQWMWKAATKKGDIKRLNYIHSKDWPKDFARLEKIKNQEKREQAVIELITKLGTQYGLSTGQIGNLVQTMKGSDDNG